MTENNRNAPTSATAAMIFPGRVAHELEERRKSSGISESEMSRRMGARPGYWNRDES